MFKKYYLRLLSLVCELLGLTACGGAPNVPAATPTSPAASVPAATLPPATNTAAAATSTRAPATATAAATSAPANTPDNSVPTVDPNAPNTSFQTARVLDKQVKVSVKDSSFYFKIDVPRGGIITSTLSVDAFSPAPANLRLYDESQNYLKEVTAPPGRSVPLRYIYGSKGGGTTYLVLTGNSSVTLQAAGVTQNDGNTKGDAGDDFITATNAQPGTLTGVLGDGDHEDLFVFDLPKSGGILSTTIKTTDGKIKLTVYDESQNYVGETESVSNKPAAGVFQHILATAQGGRWFVRLDGDGSYAVSVSFTAQNDAGSGQDAGADFDSALPLKTGSYNGLLGDADGDDVYSFELPKTGGTLTVTLRTTNGDLKAVVFDESRNYVGETASDKTKTAASVFVTMLADEQGGKWFVHAAGKGSYTFSVAFVQQNDAGSGQDAGDSPDSATPVSSATFTGTLGFADSTDYFKVPASLGRKLSVKYSGKGSLKVTLYDANKGYVKDTSVNNGATANLVEDSGSTDDYYLEMSNGQGSYSVTLSK